MPRRKKLPVILEPEEAEKLLKIPNKRYLPGVRNRAIISVMLNMGLRVSEVSNLRPKDINLTKNKLRIVAGKGNIDRDLAIPFYTAELLRAWKDKKPTGSEYFFCIVKDRKEGIFASKTGSKLSIKGIQVFVKRYGQRAGITKNISPHTLRHTYATQYYRQTKDIETLRRILGHSDISTTTIYITLANIDVENGMKAFKEFS
ncbi:MAG: tyrosine-type recombinase/integrase [Actinomycetota bacterium]